MYSETGLEDFLKQEMGEADRLFGYIHVSGTRIMLTATSDRGSKAIFTNYNGRVPLKENSGYTLVRPVKANEEPFLWEAGRASCAAPMIWPEISEPDKVLALGTGKPRPDNSGNSRPNAIRSLWNSFMSFLDGESTWQCLENGLKRNVRADYRRVNPSLPRQSRLDAVNDLPLLRQSVHESSDLKDLGEDAYHLLVSNLYFVLDQPISYERGVYQCRGSIRCRIDAQATFQALAKLGASQLEYVTGSKLLGDCQPGRDACHVCGLYRRTVQFHVRHPTDVVILSLRSEIGT
ncbi:hypothetical protein FQN50_008360 [Emmonsiellopsis sp. PD_5]|nr:hypothetical protein FQN50_008360 [Emmonsiellopsis sp. PD_5]